MCVHVSVPDTKQEEHVIEERLHTSDTIHHVHKHIIQRHIDINHTVRFTIRKAHILYGNYLGTVYKDGKSANHQKIKIDGRPHSRQAHWA